MELHESVRILAQVGVTYMRNHVVCSCCDGVKVLESDRLQPYYHMSDPYWHANGCIVQRCIIETNNFEAEIEKQMKKKMRHLHIVRSDNESI